MTIDNPKSSEYDDWAGIWRQYLAHCLTTLPESQYKNTWSRIQDPDGDIHCLVARDETGKIVGLAHYMWNMTCASDKPQCCLCGVW